MLNTILYNNCTHARNNTDRLSSPQFKLVSMCPEKPTYAPLMSLSLTSFPGIAFATVINILLG